MTELKAEIAKQYNLEPDSQRAKMLAGMFLSHERMIEEKADGRHVDFTAFNRICEMLDRYVPPVQILVPIRNHAHHRVRSRRHTDRYSA